MRMLKVHNVRCIQVFSSLKRFQKKVETGSVECVLHYTQCFWNNGSDASVLNSHDHYIQHVRWTEEITSSTDGLNSVREWTGMQHCTFYSAIIHYSETVAPMISSGAGLVVLNKFRGEGTWTARELSAESRCGCSSPESRASGNLYRKMGPTRVGWLLLVDQEAGRRQRSSRFAIGEGSARKWGTERRLPVRRWGTTAAGRAHGSPPDGEEEGHGGGVRGSSRRRAVGTRGRRADVLPAARMVRMGRGGAWVVDRGIGDGCGWV